ncbi:cytochrome P450 [Globomyces pollinis-pini]|nr:cytochrome P450 [Globomyces pollinis-pini]
METILKIFEDKNAVRSAVVAVAALTVILSINWTPLKHIPGPTGWNLKFRIQQLVAATRGKRHELIQNVVDQHGSICKIRNVVVVSDADLVKRILTDSEEFIRAADVRIIEGIFDNALFVLPTGETWKRHRKLIQPGFGPTHIRHTAHVTLETMDKMRSIWDQRLKSTDSIQCNIRYNLSAVTLEVIGLVAFGNSFNAVEKVEKDSEWRWTAFDAGVNIMKKRFLFAEFLWPLFGLDKNSSNLTKLNQNLKDEVQQGISKKNTEEDQDSTNNNWKLNVKQRLMGSGEQGLLSEEEIDGELIGFFLAGLGTTTNTLTFTMLELCRHPDVCEKLYNEIKDVKFDNFNYVEVLSSLKVNTIFGGLIRTATKDVYLGDYLIPQGTQVFANIRAVHLNPKYWTDPLTFNPDRWLEKIYPNSFLPFGDGNHNCIGQKVAVIEAKMILFQLVKHYSFSIVEGFPLDFVTILSYTLKDGLMINLSKRK